MSAEIIKLGDYNPLAKDNSIRQVFFGNECVAVVELTVAQVMLELDERGYVLDGDGTPWEPEGINLFVCIDNAILVFDVGWEGNPNYSYTPIILPDDVIAKITAEAP